MKRLILAAALTAFAAVAQEHAAQGGHGAAQAEHGGGHADLQMWKWANFAILAALLGWLIAKNAGPFFRGRTEEIRKSIDDAQRFKQESEARAAEIRTRIGNLSAEVDRMRASAKQEMDAEAARMRAETEAAVARIQDNAQQEIAAAVKQARAGLESHAAKLAMELAEAKVKARLDAGRQNALVDGFVAKLSRTSNN